MTDTKLCSIDTNVLVRYIAEDDEKQTAAAAQFIESWPGKILITLPVLLETLWVLSRLYQAKAPQIERVVEILLYSGKFTVQSATQVETALQSYKKHSADFSDCLIMALSKAHGAADIAVYSFDKQAIKAGMQRLP